MMNIGNVATVFINTKKAPVRAIVANKIRQQISQRKTMNEQEALALKEAEKDFPVKSRIFRDVRDNTYHTQFSMLDIKYMEELK